MDRSSDDDHMGQGRTPKQEGQVSKLFTGMTALIAIVVVLVAVGAILRGFGKSY